MLQRLHFNLLCFNIYTLFCCPVTSGCISLHTVATLPQNQWSVHVSVCVCVRKRVYLSSCVCVCMHKSRRVTFFRAVKITWALSLFVCLQLCTKEFSQYLVKSAGGHPSHHWWMANKEADDESCKHTCRQFLGMRIRTAGMPLRMFDHDCFGFRCYRVAGIPQCDLGV